MKKSKEQIIVILEGYANHNDTSKETANFVAGRVNLDQATVRKYFKQLEIPFIETGIKKLNKRIPVEINGVSYPSIHAAAQATGISSGTLFYRHSPQGNKRSKERYNEKAEELNNKNYLSRTRSWGNKIIQAIKHRISTKTSYKGLECKITPEYVNGLIEKLDNCPICNVLFNKEIRNDIVDEQPSIDRVYPKSGYVKSNVRVVCYRCNVNHRADLFRDKCRNCSFWVMEHFEFCYNCGEEIEKNDFTQNWREYLKIKDRVMYGEELELATKKKRFLSLKSKIASDKGNLIPLYGTGLSLANSFFKNRFKAFRSNERSYHSFVEDDSKMEKVIQSITDDGLKVRTGLIYDYIRKQCSSVSRVYNFRPATARIIIDKLLPENGIVYDYSAGFGGRLLGTAASSKKANYIGIDPNEETFEGLVDIKNFLKNDMDYKPNVEIYKECSENFCPSHLIGKVDMAFSSPPYYDLERYSNELTQCYIKFKNYEIWKEEYLLKTLENIYKLLKKEGLFIINIKNTGSYDLGDDMKLLAEKVGFKLVEELQMELSTKSNIKAARRKSRLEPIFIFKKH